jgi:DNA-binding transcriptional ArsR family regulator
MTAEKSETLVRTEKGICVLRDGEYIPLTKEELQQLIDEKETAPKAEKIEVSDTPVVEKEPIEPPVGWQVGNKGDKVLRNRNLRKAIVSLLNKTRKPMCVEEVSAAIGCAWVTARQILTDLTLEGKFKFFVTREGYGRLYQINEEWLNAKAAEKETE